MSEALTTTNDDADVRDDDDYEYDQDSRCQTCGGDGFCECDGDCPESDDCGCPYGGRHFIECPNCGGSGKSKDQWYW